MEYTQKVLVIGRHQDMMQKVLKMLQNEGYEAIGELTNENAITTFKQNNIQAVVIGGGVDTESRNLFHTEFSAWNPEIKIIDAHPQTVLSDLASIFQ